MVYQDPSLSSSRLYCSIQCCILSSHCFFNSSYPFSPSLAVILNTLLILKPPKFETLSTRPKHYAAETLRCRAKHNGSYMRVIIRILTVKLLLIIFHPFQLHLPTLPILLRRRLAKVNFAPHFKYTDIENPPNKRVAFLMRGNIHYIV